MVIDIETNVIDYVKNYLSSQGFSGFNTLKNHEILVCMFNYHERLISPQKRTILKSDVFTCDPTLIHQLQYLENKITSGIDIKPHTSDKILNLKYFDHMLSDWGVFHLHLGINPDPRKPGFVQRTGPLLFARFDESKAYFINVMRHGDWECRDIVEVIHRNWPTTIATKKLDYVVDISLNPSDSEIKKLRKANANYMLKLNDGSIYAPIALGYTLGGNSVTSTMRTISVKRNIRDLQKKLVEDSPKIVKKHFPEYNGDFKVVLDIFANSYSIFFNGNEIKVPFDKSVHDNLFNT